MNRSNTENDFGAVEADTRLREFLLTLQVRVKLTAVDKVHDKVDLNKCKMRLAKRIISKQKTMNRSLYLVSGLEREIQVHKERMNEALQQILLSLRVINFVSLDDRLLVQHPIGKDEKKVARKFMAVSYFMA